MSAPKQKGAAAFATAPFRFDMDVGS